MSARAVILAAITLGSFAVMTVLGAILTHGKPQGPLSLADVLIPAAIPVLLVVAATAASHTRSAQQGGGDEKRG